jgi:hypothetical protein
MPHKSVSGADGQYKSDLSNHLVKERTCTTLPTRVLRMYTYDMPYKSLYALHPAATSGDPARAPSGHATPRSHPTGTRMGVGESDLVSGHPTPFPLVNALIDISSSERH